MWFNSIILLSIITLLIVFLLRPGLLRRDRESGKKPQPAEAQPTEIAADEPVPAPGAHALSYPTFAAPLKIEYSPLDSVAPPRKLEEVAKATMESVRKLFARTASLPAASLKLDAVLRDHQASSKHVSSLVSTNPVISSRILRIVNSSVFGLASKVTSVGRAITLLGFNNVRSIVLQDVLRSALPRPRDKDRQDYNALWLHSTAVSAASLFLSRHVLNYTEHDMGTIGLLHDIGKYFLPVLEDTNEMTFELPTITFSAGLDIDHAQLGSLLAAHWGMAETVVKCIGYHHYPHFFPLAAIPEQYAKPVFIVCMANLLCKVLGHKGPDQDLLPIRDEYYQQFSLPADLTALLNNNALIREIEKARAVVESYLED